MFRKLLTASVAVCSVALVGSPANATNSGPGPRSTATAIGGPQAGACRILTAVRYTNAPDVIVGTGRCKPSDYSLIEVSLTIGTANKRQPWGVSVSLTSWPNEKPTQPGLIFVPLNQQNTGRFTFNTGRIPPQKVNGRLEAMPNTKLQGLAKFGLRGSLAPFCTNTFYVSPPRKPPATTTTTTSPPHTQVVITTRLTWDVQAGQVFRLQLTAAHGYPPYTWAILADLPQTLRLSRNGLITGTIPSQPATLEVKLGVTDRVGNLAVGILTLVITSDPSG